ncbi:MAG: response regulator [Candidatus Riflebacteria bacterium]|nr:response regulator [Candidatus Riflebacteria bacterium]
MAKTYKVLIADDDADHVTIVKAILEQHGYHALEAFNGEEALQEVEKHDPDLVLLDIMMPKIDGIEVVRRLKDNPKTRDLPVIMFSAKSGTREIMESFNYGASNYLIKPIDTERLLEKIQATLRKEEFRETLEKRFKPGDDSAGAPAAGDAEQTRDRLAGLAASVGLFLTAIETPLAKLQKELVGLGSERQSEREVRLVTRKLD